MELSQEKFITKAELTKLLNTVSQSKSRASIVDLALYRLLASSGLRISEALSLRWEDLLEEYLIIRAQNSKNKKRQTVAIGKKLRMVLDEFILLNPYPDSPYLFNSAKGRLKRESAHVRLKGWLYQAKLRDSISLHSFRHTFALTAIEAGIPLPLIRDTLRHSNISITSVYLSFSKDSLDKLRDVF